ncbi:MAG: hypothetical protein F6K55_34680 [Moorea sp. SIO4A3]|nr:hypothetical protein [Moorena sp. SIO4A3]
MDWCKLLQLLGNTTTRVAVIFPTPLTINRATCLLLACLLLACLLPAPCSLLPLVLILIPI